MTEYKNPAFNQFIGDLRHHYEKSLPETEHWGGVHDLLKILISDQELCNASKAWEAKKGREYVLHHDQTYDFFVGGLVREAKHVASVHDHGPTWTVYGVLDGKEITHLYKRLDDGKKPGYGEVKLLQEYEAPAGHVDIVPPHIPHAENGNSPRSVAITVRTTKPGGYDQIRFNLETGKTWTTRGLDLVPLAV